MDYYPLSDLLYRTVALTDDPGEGDVAVVEAYDTDAYGNTLIFNDPGPDETWFTDDDVTTNDPICPFIFTGRRYDPETGIYFYRARYFGFALGRFVSRDPTGQPDGINLYEYVKSRPTSATDPAGTTLLVVGSHSCNLTARIQHEAVDFQGHYSFSTALDTDSGMEDPSVSVTWGCGGHGLYEDVRTAWAMHVEWRSEPWGPEESVASDGDLLSCVGARTRIEIKSSVVGLLETLFGLGIGAVPPQLVGYWDVFSKACAVCDKTTKKWRYYGGALLPTFHRVYAGALHEAASALFRTKVKVETSGTYGGKLQAGWREKEQQPLPPSPPKVVWS